MSEPTICAECKYCCVTDKYTCLWPQKDFVTGDYGPKSCRDYNDGKCVNYEDANWVLALKSGKPMGSTLTASEAKRKRFPKHASCAHCLDFDGTQHMLNTRRIGFCLQPKSHWHECVITLSHEPCDEYRERSG